MTEESREPDRRCPQRPQSQPARQARASDLRPRDAGRRRGGLPPRRQGARACDRVSSEQSRIRDHRLNSRRPRPRSWHCHQSRRLHPYLGRYPRCAERFRRADHRSAHFQRAQARAFPASFVRVGRRLGRHRRLRNAGLRLRAASGLRSLLESRRAESPLSRRESSRAFRLNSRSPARSRPSPWRRQSESRSRSAAAHAPSARTCGARR